VLSAAAPKLAVLILGNSIFEGVGTALLIPPVYILTTLLFTDVESRARAFGAISGMGGVGAATGPLIGGAITTAITWRLAFVFQALVVVVIVVLARGITDPKPAQPGRPLDPVGAILSAGGAGGAGGRDHGRRQESAADAGLIAAGAVTLAGFATTIVGVFVLLLLAKGHASAWHTVPGPFLIGTGVGLMLTPSVNVVQSAFPLVMAFIGLIGLGAAWPLPRTKPGISAAAGELP
jgi:MFS family permease